MIHTYAQQKQTYQIADNLVIVHEIIRTSALAELVGANEYSCDSMPSDI